MSLRDLFRKKKDCSHVAELEEVEPSSLWLSAAKTVSRPVAS